MESALLCLIDLRVDESRALQVVDKKRVGAHGFFDVQRFIQLFAVATGLAAVEDPKPGSMWVELPIKVLLQPPSVLYRARAFTPSSHRGGPSCRSRRQRPLKARIMAATWMRWS